MPFKKGQSGNPGGRPRGAIADLAREARGYARLALDTLVEICQTGDNRERLIAANSLLDRGFGRPVQQIDAALVVKRLDEMDRDQLLALQARMLGIADEADQLDRTGTMN